MYIILNNCEALIIDPCISDDAEQLLKKNHIERCTIVLTHEHYDHISGVNYFRNHYGCSVISTEMCSLQMQNSKKNMSAHFDALFIMRDEADRILAKKLVPNGYICEESDIIFNDELLLDWCGLSMRLTSTPGHTIGSLCIAIDNRYVFTGDTLINGFPVITKLPSGSRKSYEDIALPYLRSFLADTLVFPGHGNIAQLREFKTNYL
ncbi:MAG: MBL fold metallo-hydrolase [Flexilinea sp.]